MICNSCGKETVNEAKFCPNCGQKYEVANQMPPIKDLVTGQMAPNNMPTNHYMPSNDNMPSSNGVPTNYNVPSSISVPTNNDLPSSRNMPTNNNIPSSSNMPTNNNIPSSSNMQPHINMQFNKIPPSSIPPSSIPPSSIPPNNIPASNTTPSNNLPYQIPYNQATTNTLPPMPPSSYYSSANNKKSKKSVMPFILIGAVALVVIVGFVVVPMIIRNITESITKSYIDLDRITVVGPDDNTDSTMGSNSESITENITGNNTEGYSDNDSNKNGNANTNTNTDTSSDIVEDDKSTNDVSDNSGVQNGNDSSEVDVDSWNYNIYIAGRGASYFDIAEEVSMDNGVAFILYNVYSTDLGDGTMSLEAEIDFGSYYYDVYLYDVDFLVLPMDGEGNILADASKMAYIQNTAGEQMTMPLPMSTVQWERYSMTFIVPADTKQFVLVGTNALYDSLPETFYAIDLYLD